MKLSLILGLTLFAGVASGATSTTHFTHAIGGGFGDENAKYDNAGESHDGSIGTLTYQYLVNSSSSFKFSYIKGNSDDFNCFFFCNPNNYTDQRNRFNDKQIKYQHSFPVSNRHSFFINGGIDLYENTLYTGDGSFTHTDKGTGYNVGAGWQFRAYSGFGVGVEYSYLDFDNMDVNTTTVNFSWAF